MKVAICILLLAASQVAATRFLDESEITVQFDTNVNIAKFEINGKVVTNGGVFDLEDNFICVKGGNHVSENAELRNLAFQKEDKLCFPLVFITSEMERINNFSQKIFCRMNAPEESGYVSGTKILFSFKEEGEEGKRKLQDIFLAFKEKTIQAKARVRSLLEEILKKSNAYNKLTAKINTGRKTKPEIQEEINELKSRLNRVSENITSKTQEVGELKGECDKSRSEHKAAVLVIQSFHDQAEALDNTINNNKITIANFRIALTQKLQAIANEEKIKTDSWANYSKSITELRGLALSKKSKIDAIDESVRALKLNIMNQLIDGFIHA